VDSGKGEREKGEENKGRSRARLIALMSDAEGEGGRKAGGKEQYSMTLWREGKKKKGGKRRPSYIPIYADVEGKGKGERGGDGEEKRRKGYVFDLNRL